MATIKKKAWPQQFEAIKSGKKKHDLRLADVELKEGDILLLEEWDPDEGEYTGRTLEKKVTYVSKFRMDNVPFWAEQEIRDKGFQIISLDD